MLLQKKRHPFRKIASLVKPDSKKRITLSKAIIITKEEVCYDVYSNDLGQIMLEPVVSIPASEAWVFENKEVLGSLHKGLKESATGKVKNIGSFGHHINER